MEAPTPAENELQAQWSSVAPTGRSRGRGTDDRGPRPVEAVRGLGVRDRLQLVVFAYEHGIVTPGETG